MSADPSAAERLARERLIHLVRQVARDEGVSLRQACMRVGLDRSRFDKLVAGTGRVGIRQMRETAQRMGLPLSWFEDPQLGPTPDWRTAGTSGRSTAMRALLDDLRAAGRPAPAAVEARAIAIADREGITTSIAAMRCLDLARELVPVDVG